jgi:hypothetical protein
MFEASNASLAAGSPGSTATKPSLFLVPDPFLRPFAGKGHDDASYAEVFEALHSVARIEAAVGRSQDRRCAEDLDVAFDGGHEQRRIMMRVDDREVRDDAALGFLNLH